VQKYNFFPDWPNIFLFILTINFLHAPCSPDVQLLFSRCSVNHRTTAEQQLDIDWTWEVVGCGEKGEMLIFWVEGVSMGKFV
jgi:hypothetical protein